MNNLGDYFCELTGREGKPVSKLASRWQRSEISSIARCVRSAFQRSGFDREPLRVSSKVSGPAMGNKLADYFATQLDRQLRIFKIQRCAGQGYPDRRLLRVRNKRSYALELKATRSFEPKSTHRVILTCSSGKLQRHFVAPINHLLLTVFYRKKGNRIWIQNFRLDFLEPTTKVNVRLEASVSHHLLANSPHPSFWGLKLPESVKAPNQQKPTIEMG
jgi:hypothetical protein